MCQPTQLPHLSELPTLYRSAAEHIEMYGLAKDGFCSPAAHVDGSPLGKRPTCTAGAVSWAQTGSPLLNVDDEASVAAVQFLSNHLAAGWGGAIDEDGKPDYVETVAAWNDAPRRTATEVITFLRQMAVEAASADLLCRRIAEHDDHLPCDWCPDDQAQYLSELGALRMAVTS